MLSLFGKMTAVPACDCRHVRNKLLVALIDDGLLFRRSARSAGRSIGNGIGNRPAFVILDGDLK